MRGGRFTALSAGVSGEGGDEFSGLTVTGRSTAARVNWPALSHYHRSYRFQAGPTLFVGLSQEYTAHNSWHIVD